MAKSFRYTALNLQGEEEQGSLEADSREAAMSILARRDLTVSELEDQQADTTPRRGSPVSTYRLVTFAYELSSLLSAGLTLPQALELKLRDKHDRRMHQVVKDLLAQVRNGALFSQALLNHPDVFPGIFPALVRSGESTGNLAAALRELAVYLEKMDGVRNRVVTALTYPVAVVVLACLILGALLVFIVPRFQEIYSQMGLGNDNPMSGVSVPWFTQLVLGFSGGAGYLLLGIPLAIGLLWPLIGRWGRTSSGRLQIDQFCLAIPGFGPMLLQSSLANFNKNLGLLLANGLERREAVELSSSACGNEFIRLRFEISRKPLTEGASLHHSLAKTGLFSDMMLGMIEAGECGGQLPLMLSKAAEVTETRLEQKVTRFLSLLEPLAMVAIGLVIGGTILALGVPLLSLPGLVSP